LNIVAGDPYYALDCREDDYAWCNSSPAGDLIPSVHFEQLREGLDDYRRLLTLTRPRCAPPQPNRLTASRRRLSPTVIRTSLKCHAVAFGLPLNEVARRAGRLPSAVDLDAASLRAAATKSFNGKPKATESDGNPHFTQMPRSRLRLAVKRSCAKGWTTTVGC
jgi:hypothetical protein